jgi:DNA-binding beta-propeller fold protein YncE
MKFSRSILTRVVVLISLMASLTLLSTRLQADTESCGGVTVTLPFADVQGNSFFCQIASAYFSGLMDGTTATTYSPTDPVPREQMAAFITGAMEQSLKRGNTRAALGEWWTNKSRERSAFIMAGSNPRFMACDGQTVWVSNTENNSVSRFDIKTNTLICTLTGIPSPQRIVIVSGKVFVASYQSPGRIYRADIRNTTNGPIYGYYSGLGPNPSGITFDGENLWTANAGTGPGTGSISRVSNYSTYLFTAGFSQPSGILFDGANLWVTDYGDASLKRVDTTTGAVLQTIALSGAVQHPVFDGANLWVPCAAIPGVPDSLYVVRGVGALTGTVLAQLTGNGLNGAFQAAFDGERICVTNANAQSVSLWKASDLSPITSVEIDYLTSHYSRGVCSDGITFFVGMRDSTATYSFIHRL